jgi:hypothetical protein
MNPIQEAIEEIESREPGDKFTYTEVARRYNIDGRTLARRYQGVTGPRGLPIDPYTHKPKSNSETTARRLLNDVCHRQGS